MSFSPLLSVVATSRNDNHGANLLARMQLNLSRVFVARLYLGDLLDGLEEGGPSTGVSVAEGGIVLTVTLGDILRGLSGFRR